MTSNDQLTVYPEYLNTDFFKRCLTHSLSKNDIKIESIQLSPGSGSGQNYVSNIYRAIVKYTTIEKEKKTIPLIIKSIYIDGNREFLDTYDVYGKEVTMYLEVLPYIHENMNGDRVAPRCHFATKDPVRTIVFDDLNAQGYSLQDRKAGLNEDHFKLILQKIGKFHAASLPIIGKEPLNHKQYEYGFFDPECGKDELHQVFFRNNFKKAAEMVLEMPGYEHFAPKLMKIYDNFVKIMAETVKRDSKSLTVLNHGDLWTSNMLFKYDDESGKPIDVILIDYQLGFINSLGLDLNHYFATSAQLSVLERQDELLAKYYYPNFAETMQRMGSKPIPSLEQVLNEFKSRCMYGLINVIGELPLLCLKEEDAVTNNYGDFLDESLASKARNAGMAIPRFIAIMKHALKYYEKINLFE